MATAQIAEKTLDHLTAQLRKTAAHQEADTEKQTAQLITRAYNDILNKVAQYYGKYNTGGTLSGKELRRLGKYQTFFKHAETGAKSLSDEAVKMINESVENVYQLCYDGTVDAIRSATSTEELHDKLGAIQGTTAETLRHVTSSETMKTALKNYTAQNVTDIRQALTAGLVGGESYQSMAKRIEKCANRSYNKAICITRTECNRAINQGLQDASEAANPYLQEAGLVEVKIWHSMEDELVRDTHQHLDGKMVYVTDTFESHGATADCPGAFGVASEDINCRCFLEYRVMTAKEFVDAGGILPEDVAAQMNETNADDAESESAKTVVNLMPAALLSQLMASRVLTGGVNSGTIEAAARDVLHERIESGAITTTINPEKQLPHIQWSSMYREADHKSYFYEGTTLDDVQKIIDEKKETGEVLIYPSGEIVEYVKTGGSIGEVIDKQTGESLGDTDRVKIHYSKKRTHIVPTEKEGAQE